MGMGGGLLYNDNVKNWIFATNSNFPTRLCATLWCTPYFKHKLVDLIEFKVRHIYGLQDWVAKVWLETQSLWQILNSFTTVKITSFIIKIYSAKFVILKFRLSNSWSYAVFEVSWFIYFCIFDLRFHVIIHPCMYVLIFQFIKTMG